MGYASQQWNQRVHTLGDIAEGIFEQVSPLGAAVSYGLRRPPFKVANLTPEQRNTPDYLTGTGDFVEVQGCGRDNVLKLKVEKLEALKGWAKLGPVKWFFWNSNTSEWALISDIHLRKLVTRGKRAHGVQAFSDGNKYIAVEWDWIEGVFPYVSP